MKVWRRGICRASTKHPFVHNPATNLWTDLAMELQSTMRMRMVEGIVGVHLECGRYKLLARSPDFYIQVAPRYLATILAAQRLSKGKVFSSQL